MRQSGNERTDTTECHDGRYCVMVISSLQMPTSLAARQLLLKRIGVACEIFDSVQNRWDSDSCQLGNIRVNNGQDSADVQCLCSRDGLVATSFVMPDSETTFSSPILVVRKSFVFHRYAAFLGVCTVLLWVLICLCFRPIFLSLHSVKDGSHVINLICGRWEQSQKSEHKGLLVSTERPDTNPADDGIMPEQFLMLPLEHHRSKVSSNRRLSCELHHVGLTRQRSHHEKAGTVRKKSDWMDRWTSMFQEHSLESESEILDQAKAAMDVIQSSELYSNFATCPSNWFLLEHTVWGPARPRQMSAAKLNISSRELLAFVESDQSTQPSSDSVMSRDPYLRGSSGNLLEASMRERLPESHPQHIDAESIQPLVVGLEPKSSAIYKVVTPDAPPRRLVNTNLSSMFSADLVFDDSGLQWGPSKYEGSPPMDATQDKPSLSADLMYSSDSEGGTTVAEIYPPPPPAWNSTVSVTTIGQLENKYALPAIVFPKPEQLPLPSDEVLATSPEAFTAPDAPMPMPGVDSSALAGGDVRCAIKQFEARRRVVGSFVV